MIEIRQQLSPLISPRSIAVVGASRDEHRVGGRILRNILSAGFSGSIYPVNPATNELHGLKCYPTVMQIESPVDLAVITVPARSVEQVLTECVRIKIPAGIIITAGFAESSEDGAASQERLLRLARTGGMRLLGPNCLGLINTENTVRLNATFGPKPPLAGNIAVASQSGAIGLLLLDYFSQRRSGISSFASIGNRADISSNDLLEYWETDPQTKVIVLYLESVGNSARFLEIASRVSRKKPIIAFKAGKSRSGLRAAASHSAAIASDARSIEALFKKAGVISAASTEELLELACFFSWSDPPRGPGVAIVTNGGGPGIVLADAFEAVGLDVPLLAPDIQEELKSLLPAGAAVQNPVDMLPQAGAHEYRQVISAVGKSDAVHTITVMHIPLREGSQSEIATMLPTAEPDGAKHVIFPIFLSTDAPHTSQFPECAAPVLVKAYQYGLRRNTLDEAVVDFSAELSAQIEREIQNATVNCEASWLPYDTVSALLRLAGVNVPSAVVIRDEVRPVEVEKLGYPLVAKILTPALLHKQDIGAVRLGIRSFAELERTLGELRTTAEAHHIPAPQFLIQSQVPKGVEAFIGAVREPEIGPVVIFGWGGTFVQLLDDVAAMIPPLTVREIEGALAKLRFGKLLAGFRGEPIADQGAFVDAVRRVGALMRAAPQIVELDLNPVIVQPRGHGISVPDVRIRVQPGKIDAAITEPRRTA